MRTPKFCWLDERSEVFSDIARNIRVIVAPEEGARLLAAFFRIADPRVRVAVVRLIEDMELDALRRFS
jgi:hypothetical protein